MKRFFTLLLCVATLLSSCSQSPLSDLEVANSPLRFYVDFDNTRIEFTNQNSYRWTGDEVLGTYIHSAATTINAPATLSFNDNRALCHTMVRGYQAGDKLHTYYPWNELNDMNGISNLTLTIAPAQKQAVAGEFVAQYMPMAGSTITLDPAKGDHTVYMRPLAGFIRANIYASTTIDESVRSISYKATNGAVAGDFKVDLGKVDYYSDIELGKCDKSSVTLSVSEPYAVASSLSQSKALYMVIAAGEYEGTLTVTTDKAIYTYNYPTKVERNNYYDLNIDLSKATSRHSIEGEFGGGDGSQNNPYLIRTASDIERLVSRVNNSGTNPSYADKHYRQVCDIDLSSVKLSPIGRTSVLAFTGSYDGGGYTLNGANITPTESNLPCGLFGYTACATICNLTVKDFVINSKANYQSTLVGYADSTTISGCTFEGKTNFYNHYSGAFAGFFDGSTLSNCRINGRIENNVQGNNTSSEQNCAYTAGCVGHATNGSLIEGCTIAGDVATMGRYAAGVVSVLEDSTVRNCHILSTCEVSNVSHYCGGVVALMKGNDSLIEGCRFDGRVNTSYPIAGAIVGSITSGKVQNCISTRNSMTTSYEGYSGGIAGQIYTANTSDKAIIDRCSAYGQVEGAYNVGGIIGYVRHTQAGAYAGITNCAVLGSTLISRGANGYDYNLIGGIAGWLTGNYKSVVVANCVARPKEIHAAPISNKKATKEIIAGVVACPNIDDVVITGCYTDITRNNTLVGFEPIPAPTSSTTRQGAIFGYAYNPLSVSDCFHIASLATHGSVASGKKLTQSNCQTVTTAEMTDGTLLTLLNAAASSYTPATNTPTAAQWIAGADGYPVPEGLPVDTTPANAEPKRVSVIGDSISTFRGYIPYSYSTYYPRADGTFLSVSDMYWYHLIYKHMTNARLERNIAYSGSWVTKADTSKDTYFAKRFIDQNGVGDADIVIIHGGTNDWNKNAVNLVSGLGVRATSGPTDAQLQPLFAAADAAKTRAEVEALNDTTFCEAYIKLIKLILERNPETKIVCLIGDYLGVGVQQATHKMAAHFPNNCKCVDLRAVNGFNDQTYMPKLYYAPDNTGQCHPNQKAMAYIGEKIYKELGDWLEE